MFISLQKTTLFPFTLFLLCFSDTIAAATTATFTTKPLNLTNFKFLGDAHIFNNTFRLTRDLLVPNSGAGRVLYNNPIPFRRPGNPNPTSFTTHFSFSVLTLNSNSIGGGLAFVISPDDRSIGAAGGFLGIPAGAIAVEFDTVKDVEFKDVNGNHVGLDINSVVSLQVANLDSVSVNLKSGVLIHSWVEYIGPNHQLKVFISNSKTKPKLPVLSVTIDLYPYVNEFMFVGFSGSTQGSTEVHSVAYWNFTSFFDDPETKPIGPNSSPPVATISTTPAPTNTSNLNKLIIGLVGALAGIISLIGSISCYLKFQNSDQSRHFWNIFNCCSNVNNIDVNNIEVQILKS